MGCVIPREVIEARLQSMRTNVAIEQQKILRDLLASSVTYISNGVPRNKPNMDKVFKK